MSRHLARRGRVWAGRAGVVAAGAALVVTPAVLAGQAGAPPAPPASGALLASSAWHDWVDGQRAPQVPPAADTESAIVVLDGPAIVDVPEASRTDALARIQAAQLEVEAAVQGMGGVVTHRYRTLVNGLAVRVPSGRLSSVAEIAGISAVVPVTYLAPAAALPTGTVSTRDGAVGAPAPLAGGSPLHIALIDSGVDVTHPWLGGGIGPTYPIIGGVDLVEGDSDPSPDPTDPGTEAHGTQMASIILRSPALAGLPGATVPRMVVYRVTAREMVDGRVRTLARSDRVLGALEMAVDPNRDGLPDDTASVIVLGLARGFDGTGIDPVARALSAANRVGAVVVLPAGNDGPTETSPGTIGSPASAPGVLTVGGLAASSAPRTADLEASVGPAGARLGPLPLMGADPSDVVRAGAPVVVVPSETGVASGADVRDFAGVGGRSVVAGAVAMVSRSGAPIAETARRAAAAGAVGLVVWDESGSGAFPGIAAGAAVPIPVVGLGPQQGRALSDLLAREPGGTVRITERVAEPADPAVASFSSRGPTADGRLEPELVAPAVGVEAAYPGRDSAGLAQQAPLTGTSAAAASVAAEALRLRVDHPGFTPADVRSVLVQATAPVPAASPVDDGAGAAPDASALITRSLPGVSVDPPIITGPRSRDADRVLGFVVHDLTGTGGRYRVLLQGPDGRYVPQGPAFRLDPDGRERGKVTIPRAQQGDDAPYRARILVVPDGGQVAAGSAPVWSAPGAVTPDAALGVPRVRVTGSGLGQVSVRVGMRTTRPAGLSGAVLHDVAVILAPDGGGAPIRMSQAEPSGDWPAATYRLLLSRRAADGAQVPAGRYRVVVAATGPDGRVLRTRSTPFRVGG